MDGLTALLDSARANGAFVLRSLVSPPWSMRIEDHAPLSLIVTTRGTAWLVPDGGEPLRLEPGDVALVRGPRPEYVLADDPATAPFVAVDERQRPRELRATDAPMQMLGARSWGNDPEPATIMLSGTYQARGEISATLLDLLPEVAVVRSSASADPLIDLLAEELRRDDLGQETVLDRLLDLLLIRSLRTWVAGREHGPGWVTAYADPTIGRALRLMHGDPAHPWTIESLARAVGLSRAGFARRFTALVGTPPLRYLTGWRLKRAADLLRDPGRTLGAIADEVGYGTAFALSTAFRRERGESPRDYRSRVLRAGPPG